MRAKPVSEPLTAGTKPQAKPAALRHASAMTLRLACAAAILVLAACAGDPVPAAPPALPVPPAPAQVPAAAAPAVDDGLIAAPKPPTIDQTEDPIVQAEDSGVGGAVAAAGADGGQAVTSARDWQPLIRMPAPSTALGPRVELWVRHRDGPLQAKGLGSDGKQAELSWSWAKPKDWTWTQFGPYDASAVAGGAIVIRGQGGTPPFIDAARWKAGPRPEQPTVMPEAPIPVTVTWTKRIGTAGPWAYGLNLFRGYDAAVAGDQRYHQALRTMSPGLMRWWSAEMDGGKPQAWLDHKTRTWKRDVVTATVRAHPAGIGEVMITIGHFPPWMDADKDGLLDEAAVADWAALCADLVRIVNVECKAGVGWWEVTNERDDEFHNKLVQKGLPSRIDLLVRAYCEAARAMKAVDPSIRTGGPAAIRPDLIDGLRLFVRGAKDQLDFYSYHAYASGDAGDHDERIFGRRITAFRDAIAGNAAMLREEIPGREVPTLLGEYNISWTWQTRDPRMANHKGAVFDALVVATAATAGATATTAWNEMDGIYGKMDGEFRLRPQAGLFELLNRHGRGAIAASEPSVLTEGNPVVAYAVRSERERMLMLVNRANVPARIDAIGAGMGADVHAVRIGADGRSEPSSAEALSRLPAHSVTVLWSVTPP